MRNKLARQLRKAAKVKPGTTKYQVKERTKLTIENEPVIKPQVTLTICPRYRYKVLKKSVLHVKRSQGYHAFHL